MLQWVMKGGPVTHSTRPNPERSRTGSALLSPSTTLRAESRAAVEGLRVMVSEQKRVEP